MTLSDAEIERWSRQIILPEVGGAGQARLLAAHAAVNGTDASAIFAATLLERAGMRITSGRTTASLFDVRIVLDTGAVVLGVADGKVGLVVSRPCEVCLPLDLFARSRPRGSDGPAIGLAVGALAAAEALRATLSRPHEGRLHRLDLDSGLPTTIPLAASGCAACGGRQ